MTSAEIITIGTEILLGEIVDTNTRYIAQQLRGLGIDLYRTTTIGDNQERIAKAIQDSMHRADIVITTGGLGPTVDDPTREAVAKAVGVKTEFREELWQQIAITYSRYGRGAPTENQKRQAYVPQGSLGVPNPVGTAPCFIVETARNTIISLPGVPNEMEVILHEAIIPHLQNKFKLDEIIKIRVIHTSGLGEGSLDEKIADLETLSNPTVGLAAHTGVVDIRITAKARNEAQALAMIAEIEAQVRERLGIIVFGVDDDRLERVVLDLLARRGLTITIIESVPDGILAHKIPHTKSQAGLNLETLTDALRDARSTFGADIALGVAIYPEERAGDMVLISPTGEKTRHITFGGPPRSLPRWAANLSLNWLRTTLLEMK